MLNARMSSVCHAVRMNKCVRRATGRCSHANLEVLVFMDALDLEEEALYLGFRQKCLVKGFKALILLVVAVFLCFMLKMHSALCAIRSDLCWHVL